MTTIKRALISLAVVFFLTTGCGGQNKDSQEIYQAVFEKVEFPGKIIYLKSQAVSLDSANFGQEDLQYYQRFQFPNNSATHSRVYFKKLEIFLIDEDERKSIFKGGCEENWQTFHHKFPEAITLFGVSHVGFSETGRAAIVYLEGGSGCQDAQGVLFSLEKADDRWKVIDMATLWKS